MIIKISKNTGFVRIAFYDKQGNYIGLFHADNIMDGYTSIYIPEGECMPGTVKIVTIENEVKLGLTDDQILEETKNKVA